MRRGLCLGFLFFVSGFTGLVYEVLWTKYLALLLGSTAHAQIGVLAVFMGGLALGSALWGDRADRSARPLRLYAALEIAIGLSAVAFVFGFEWMSRFYWTTLTSVGNAGWRGVAVKALLCVAAMIVPTVCMGGTLPVLSRALGLQRPSLGRGVAYLYAVNSFGAAAGSVLSGFVLVPGWGLDVPLLFAAAVNLLIGVAAALLDRLLAVDVADSETAAPAPLRAERSEADDIRGYRWLVPLCAAVSGAVAMIYEVAWIRLCSLVLGSSTYSFCIMLTAFIVGIACGGLVYTLSHPAALRPLRFFVYSSLVSAAVLLSCLPLYDRLPFLASRLTWLLHQHGASFAAYQAAMLALCVAVMLPLTFIGGLNFPALAQAAGAAHAGVGRPVSYVLFANTMGTIAGAVATGLYLMPLLGLQSTFLLGCVLTVSTVLAVLLCDRSLPRPAAVVAVVATVVVAAGYACIAPRWDLRLLTAGEFREHDGLEPMPFTKYVAGLANELLFYRDGAGATISVERRTDDVVLRINGKADASAHGDRDTQVLLGHLPAILHPAARRALVIGYGSGMTTAALLRHPLESVDVVEISPEVMASDNFFRQFTGNPLADQRTHVFLEDARTFLYRARQRYDLIVSEPSNPWLAGIANLFTTEFFEQAKDHLADDGLLVQWFHTYESSNSVAALILRTLTASFAEVRVQPNVWDVIVVASPSPMHPDRPAMGRAFAAAGDLAEIGIDRLSTLLASEVLSSNLVRSAITPGPLNRDRLPLLEYAAPRAFFDGRTSSLVASAPTVAAGDLLQNPADLTMEELQASVDYLTRTDMLSFTSSLRLLAEWMKRDPTAPPLHAAIARWSNDRPLSPLLLPALLQQLPASEMRSRSEYLEGLLEVLESLLPRPTAEQVRSVEPSARAAADDGKTDPLQRIGRLYLAAADYAEALRVFDDLERRAPWLSPEQRLLLQCGRGQALSRLHRDPEALEAFRTCKSSADPRSRQEAEEGIQRVTPG